MANPTTKLFNQEARSDWLRLRTLILLRWMAIIGQITTIAVAHQVYHIRLELGYCAFAVGTSVVINLIAFFVFPQNKRLSQNGASLLLLFDILQLSLLLFLTGGLSNPFAMLIVAPVIISATALQLRSTVLLALVAIGMTTLVARVHIPLRNELGYILKVPDVFVFGSWLAIVIGIVFISLYARRVTSEMHSMSQALLATQMALAREQKLTDLGGVVAAAAHELGTPLATIKLASAELIDDLADRPDLQEDAQLIHDQADRCRDILRSMGRAGKDDLHMRSAPVATVISEAAEPHLGRGKVIKFSAAPIEGSNPRQPTILRRPEIIHGVRNLVQNAVDFAEHTVWIEIEWTSDLILLRIADDGAGFPPHMLGRIGDPFLRRRKSDTERAQRPEYEGMGLGLFIAKTLLERSGAELTFANGSDPFLIADERPLRSGAIVEVVWPRDAIAPASMADGTPLGLNVPFEI
ncbi:sensor histidine kinase RegB [Pseudogemmobacter sp. W21_MBD1_M6]|uniref:sensor histidine kinase RegB n=1 Tax=Pseudogemmobacter sp. W21_MBD1_M6 TaxID=3240271 RepID=UPI003F9E5171